MSNADGLSDARRRANELLGQKKAESISAGEKERRAQDIRSRGCARYVSPRKRAIKPRGWQRDRRDARPSLPEGYPPTARRKTFARLSGRIKRRVVYTRAA
jgi:hypothetical protein